MTLVLNSLIMKIIFCIVMILAGGNTISYVQSAVVSSNLPIFCHYAVVAFLYAASDVAICQALKVCSALTVNIVLHSRTLLTFLLWTSIFSKVIRLQQIIGMVS